LRRQSGRRRETRRQRRFFLAGVSFFTSLRNSFFRPDFLAAFCGAFFAVLPLAQPLTLRGFSFAADAFFGTVFFFAAACFGAAFFAGGFPPAGFAGPALPAYFALSAFIAAAPSAAYSLSSMIGTFAI